MRRVGVLGLEPFLVGQVERLDRNLDIVLLDAVDDESRADLDLAVVLVNREHASAPRMLGSHPHPPVVVIEDGPSAADPGGPDDPIRLGRPISSPDLLDAIDRSCGVSRLRRSVRAITIQQDDAAVADRWAAVARTAAALAALAVLAQAAADPATDGPVWPLLLLTLFAIGRSLWWRLTPALVGVDAVMVVTLIAGASIANDLPSEPLTFLAAAVALEAGFVLRPWRAVVGALVAVSLLAALWLGVLGHSLSDDSDTIIAAALVLTSVATGAMARRLWADRTETRSSELRGFRSTLYDLSRRQAVVAVSFDLGTVAHDALARLIADVRPGSAMVLVADGAGPLQVAASHNLATPPPVRLTWQAGMHDPRQRPAPRDAPAPPAPDDAPEHVQSSAGVDRNDTAADRGADAAGHGDAAVTSVDRSAPTTGDAHATGGVDDAEARSAAESRRVADLLARTTIESIHRARLASVLERLGPSLPPGRVRVHGAELDGELLGALVVVDAGDPRPLDRNAEEMALTLDSVRLFNRLRAFTRDQERARIGRSLHDGVMQTLAHVAFELDRVSNESWDESQAANLGRLRDHVLGTVDEMRSVVNDLRTVRLDRGLPAALEAMAMTLSPAGGPVIDVVAPDVGPLPGDIEEQFLRVAEEALTNSVRHSGARNVHVELSRTATSLRLQIRDDGFGFTRSRVGQRDGGVGLTSMYQRAKSIGAGLDIDTGASGTVISLHQSLETHQVSTPLPDVEPVAATPRARRRFGRRG